MGTDGDRRGLVERARTGERWAFREIVESHQEKLLYLALGMTRSRQDAEDIVQEAFLKAYSSLDRFRGDASLGSWLYRITVNLCIDHRRRRRPQVPLVAAEEAAADRGDGFPEPADEHPAADPGRYAGSRSIGRRVDRAVLGLTPLERSVFVLRFYNELRLKEIARVLERSEGTVKNMLFRALRKLRRELAELAPEAGREVTG